MVLWLDGSHLFPDWELGAKWPLLDRGPRVAVLGFENLGKSEAAYFADGLTEEITKELASTPSLRVIARPTVVRYMSAGKPLADMGKALRADYVLQGTVVWGQGPTRSPRVRITAWLTRVADGAVIWAKTFDQEMHDVVEGQKLISRRVVATMSFSLMLEPRLKLLDVTRYPNDTKRLEALGLKLRSKGRLVEAIEVFQRASDLEPQPSRLTPNIAETYRALRDHEQADRYLVKAFSLGPRGFFWKQSALNQRAWTGDPTKVRAFLDRSPVSESPELQAIAFQVDLDERDYARALARLSPRWLQHLSPQDQSRIAVMAVLARERLGDSEGALKAAQENCARLESYVKHFPSDPMMRAYLAMALAQLGQRNEALAQAERAVHDNRNDAFSGPRAIEVQAMVDALLGRRHEAVTRLTRLLSMSYQDSICISQLRIDPIWDPLRGDPGFEDLLQGQQHNSP